jgi:small subunit ribosomal protein S17
MKNTVEQKINRKKTLEGVVVSNKMTNAVTVKVSRRIPHPKYQKIITHTKKYHARTDKAFNIGDNVVIEESRPLSKTIRWIVIETK